MDLVLYGLRRRAAASAPNIDVIYSNCFGVHVGELVSMTREDV